MLFSLFSVSGAPKTWNGGNGNWNNAANWTPSGVPVSTDDVVINSTGTVTVDIDASCNNFTLTAGIFILNNATSNTLTINGNYSQTGGVFDFNSGTSGNSLVNLKQNFSNTAGAGSITTSGNMAPNGIFTFNGSGVQTFYIPTVGAAIWAKYIIPLGNSIILLSNIALSSADLASQAVYQGELNVSGTLDVGTYTVTQNSGVSGTGVFTLNSGATLITANAGGIDGSISATNMTRTFSTTANYIYNGTATQITGNGLTGANNLTINNSAGVTLSDATAVSGVLSLTSGILATTATNLLSITNTATTAITGGSSASYINGPVNWTLPSSLGTGSTYIFPVGNTTFLPFSLLNPTTGTGTVTAQVQATSGSAGGTYDATLASLSTTEYWSLTTTGNFTNSSVSLTRQTAITPLDVIGGSTALSGPYASLSGTAGTNSVTGSNDIGSNRHFVLAGKIQTITTGTISGSPFCPDAIVSVPFTISGTFNSGNIFKAQLSDGAGSFSSPVDIGQLTSQLAGTISATIPAVTTAGAGYHIQVVSSNPVVTGSANGSNLTINALPSAPVVGTITQPTCATATGSVVLSGLPAGAWTLTASGGATQTGSGTTATFTGLAASTTYTFTVTLTSTGCTSVASGNAVINAQPVTPSITGTTPGSRYGSGTISLSATASSGTLNWYAASSGGSSLFTGTTFTTPSISTTTTYYVDATLGSCTSVRSPVVATINPFSITAGGGGTTCAGSTINLTSTGSNITNQYWTGPNSFYSLDQNPVISNATTSMTGTYTVTGSHLSGNNLVTNGTFEAGNSGFTTDYTLAAQTSTGLQPESTYDVVALPSSRHASFCSCVDHTSGTGLQLVINGASSEKTVWSQTITVVPSTAYQFTYWEQTVVNGNDPSPSKLQLFVNGTNAGPVYTANPTTGVWTQFTYNWTAGPGITSAILMLKNENFISGGNDFALDDIVFQPVAEATATIGVTVNPSPSVSFTVQPGANASVGVDVTYTTQPGMTGYTWGLPGTLGTDYIITSGGTGSSNTVTVKYLTTGSKTVTINYTDSNGCTLASPLSSTPTTVYPLPQGSISANGPFCTTGAGQLTWTATTGTGPFTVGYNDGTSNRTASGVVSGTPFAVFTTPVTSNTTYTLVSVTDANGCIRTTGFTGSSATITVNALPAAPSAGVNTYTYDGTLKTATASVGFGETVDWYAAASGGSTIAAPGGINFGTYSAYAAARNTSTACVSATRTLVTLTINKATITITAGNQTVTYGTLVATVTGAGSYTPTGFVNLETSAVITGSATYTTTYTAVTAAGTTGETITPVVTGLVASNYSFTPANGTITISPAASTITATGTTSFTYTGAGQGPTTSTVVGSAGTVTYSYSGTGSTTYTASATRPTNAGTYQVIASVAADANYNGATSLPLAFTIGKVALTITAGNQTVTYGTLVATVTGAGSYTPTGFVNLETSAVITGSATYTTTYTATTAPATAGVTITPVLTSLTATNYSFTPVNGTITISPAASTITATGTTSFTYTGAVQGPTTSTVTGSTGAVTYSYSGTGATSYGPSATRPTGAGTYQVTATVAADANYNGATSSPLAFTINQVALTITANDQSKCVGTLFSFTGTEFTSVGLINNDEVSSVTLTSTGSSDTAVTGIYNIVSSDAIGAGLSNYAITYSSSGILTVNDLPTGTLNNSGTICSGTSTSLTFTKTVGIGPFDLVINGTTYTDIASPGTINISPLDQSTTYTLTLITDKGVSPNCSNVVNVSNTITVYPIEVNATLGLAQACYNTVKEAFDKINNGTHKGVITVKVHGSTIETLSAVLNASGSGSSSYTSVLLYPTATGLSISGSLNTPLIDLNGADNVTFDGSVNGIGSSKDLTISNASTSNAATTSTIRFINDASINIIRNCTIQGSSTAAAIGTIFFSGGTATGNDGNMITNNSITSVGANLPVNAIYSAGTSVAIDNSGNTISNNDIQDFFSPTLASNGIFVSTFNSGWTISDNRFFQTASRNSTGTSIVHRAIQITSGNGHNVNNNIIGFASSSSTGIMTYTGSGTTTPLFRAIELSVGTTTASSIQSNTISGISLLTTSGTATLPGIFSGISVLAGKVDIGTVTGNTIGATTGNGSIAITSTTTGGVITGIYSTSTSTVNIQNNKIGSISTPGGDAIGYTFHGIYTAGVLGNYTIASNTIGSSDALTSNSISIGNATTTVVCTVNGIANAATGTISITGNTVQNVTVNSTVASILNGILNSAGSGTFSITGNNVIGINNTGSGAIIGISNTTTLATVANINNNEVSSLTLSGTGAFTGITSTTTGAAVTFTSNQVKTISRNVAGAITGIVVNGFAGNSSVTKNTLDNISGKTAINGLTIGNTGTPTSLAITENTLTNLVSSGTGGSVIALTSSNLSPSLTMDRNVINTLSSTGTTASVTGISLTAGAGVSITNHNIYSLSASGITTPVISGILAVSTGTVGISGNKIYDVSTAGAAASAFTFNGISTSGAAGNFTISGNTIGSTTTANSIAIGTSGATTAICTFVGIASAATGINSITDNTIQNATTYGTGTSTIQAINCSGNPIGAGIGSTLNITGNNIISNSNFGTGILRGISNAVGRTANPLGTANVNNNVIRSNKIYSANGTFTGILSSAVASVEVNINDNHLGNTDGDFVTYDVANSGALIGITVSGATGASALSIQNNDIRGIVHTVAGSNNHTYIINAAATLSQNISNNTFTNLDVNTTGSVTFISNSVVIPANGSQTVSGNNIVTGFNKGSASGTVTGITSTTATANTGVTVMVENNDFSNITVTGNTTITGIVNTDAGAGVPSKTIRNNTLSNWTGGTGLLQGMSVSGTGANGAVNGNTIRNFSNGNSITGITTGAGNDNIFSNQIYSLNASTAVASTVIGVSVTAVAANAKNIYQNTIYSLSTGTGVTTGTVNGISITGSGSINAYRNKIYDLSSSSSSLTTGTVNGIVVSGAAPTANLNATISNNMIGSFSVPAGNSATDLIRGISVANTGANSTINVYYNTVYLNASSTGANFGTSGIFHTASVTATTAALDLRNNIIINTSTPKGTGLTVAFRRSVATVGNYASSSNNNLFYSGTPGASRLIYRDGTNSDQTLSAFQTRVSPREAQSVTEDMTTKFLSTIGSDATFLHIDPTKTTLAESGGANISGVTDDFDGETRQGNAEYSGNGAAPDIGADEFEGCLLTIASATAASSPICTGTTTLLTANGVTGTAPVVTWWSGAGGTGTYYGTGLTLVAGPGTYFARVTGDCGIPVEKTVTIIGNPTPVPTFTSQPGANACIGVDVTYTTEASMTSYVWEFSGTLNTDYTITSGGTGTSNTVTLKWLTQGSKTVTVNYTNTAGCEGATAASSTTTVNPLPTPGEIVPD